MIVTRLECPESGVVIEGEFSLGWVGRLTPEQLEFVGALLRNRGNVQRLAAEMGVAYNTARARLDDIVTALGGPPSPPEPPLPPPPPPAPALDSGPILDRLASGEIGYEEAMRLLKAEG